MKRTFIAAALALSVGAAFANPDAVVIGAGGAGLSAAVTLHDLGREVVVLEKMAMIGGNTTGLWLKVSATNFVLAIRQASMGKTRASLRNTSSTAA